MRSCPIVSHQWAASCCQGASFLSVLWVEIDAMQSIVRKQRAPWFTSRHFPDCIMDAADEQLERSDSRCSDSRCSDWWSALTAGHFPAPPCWFLMNTTCFWLCANTCSSTWVVFVCVIVYWLSATSWVSQTAASPLPSTSSRNRFLQLALKILLY